MSASVQWIRRRCLSSRRANANSPQSDFALQVATFAKTMQSPRPSSRCSGDNSPKRNSSGGLRRAFAGGSQSTVGFRNEAAEQRVAKTPPARRPAARK